MSTVCKKITQALPLGKRDITCDKLHVFGFFFSNLPLVSSTIFHQKINPQYS